MNNKERRRAKGEELLWFGRTHPKILFKPALIQLFLIALHVLFSLYIPHDTGWGWWDSWGQFTLHSLLIVLSLYYVIVPLLRWRTSTFELTSKKVVKYWGIIERNSTEIPLDRIVSIEVERGLIDRIFRCGTLNFEDAGAVMNRRGQRNRKFDGVQFSDVPRPLDVKYLIDETRYHLK